MITSNGNTITVVSKTFYLLINPLICISNTHRDGLSSLYGTPIGIVTVPGKEVRQVWRRREALGKYPSRNSNLKLDTFEACRDTRSTERDIQRIGSFTAWHTVTLVVKVKGRTSNTSLFTQCLFLNPDDGTWQQALILVFLRRLLFWRYRVIRRAKRPVSVPGGEVFYGYTL